MLTSPVPVAHGPFGDTVSCSGRIDFETAFLRRLSLRSFQVIRDLTNLTGAIEHNQLARAFMMSFLQGSGVEVSMDDVDSLLKSRPLPVSPTALKSRGICDTFTLYHLLYALTGGPRFAVGDDASVPDEGCPAYHTYYGGLPGSVQDCSVFLRGEVTDSIGLQLAGERACETVMVGGVGPFSLIGGSHHQSVLKGRHDTHCCYDNQNGGFGPEVNDEALLLTTSVASLSQPDQLSRFHDFIRDPSSVRCSSAWKCSRYANTVFIDHMAVSLNPLQAGALMLARSARELWGFFIFDKTIKTGSSGVIGDLALLWDADKHSVQFDSDYRRISLAYLVDLYNCRTFWEKIPGVKFKWVYQSGGQNLYKVTLDDGVEFGHDDGPYVVLSPTNIARRTLDGFPLPRFLFSCLPRPIRC
jgi:hypothetical protein